MDVEKFPTHHFFMSNHSYLTWNSRKQLPWRIFLLKKSLKDGAFSHGLGLKNGLTTKAKRKERRHSSQLYSSRICCVQCVPIFPISRTFKNAALLHPPSSSTQTNEKAFLSFFCYYCICDKKEDGSKRDFFNGLTLVVVLASGDADVAGFKVPFRIRAGIWTEIKVFSQDVTFGKVIATAKRKQP